MLKKSLNPHRHDRTAGVLKELAARFIQEVSSGKSLITVTHCKLSRDNSYATFFISVLPETEEARALEFAKRKRTELREFIEKESRIGKLPMVDFMLDLGDKNRVRVDELLQEGDNQ